MDNLRTGFLVLTLSLVGCPNGGGPDGDLDGGADAGTPDAGVPVTVGATLSGNQEVPTVVTNGSGSGSLTVNTDRTEIEYNLAYSDTATVTQAHIHLGGVGVNGGVFVFLCAADSTAPVPVPPEVPTPPTCPAVPGTVRGTLTETDFLPVGEVTTFAQAVDALLNGTTYINVHTTAVASGEIRGQVGPVELRAVLSGDQEVPPVATAGNGLATLRLDDEQTTLTYELEYADTAAVTQAHIHFGATGSNGGILLFLCETASAQAPDTVPTPSTCPEVPGMVRGTLTEADLLAGGTVTTFLQIVDSVLSGGTYTNVHTTTVPSGEIRGQIGVQTFAAALSGGQEVPPVSTTGTGSTLFVLDAAQTSLFYRLEYTDTATVTQAHIHAGATGVNGPIILFLCQAAAAPAPGTVPVPPICPESPGVVVGTLTAVDLIPNAGEGINSFADAVVALSAGTTYTNVHSDAFPTGEIRGQIGASD